MRGLIEYLLANPILIFVLLAWIAGAVGNTVKASNKRRALAESQRRMPQTSARPAGTTDTGSPAGSRSAEDIAAEMRRILGMEGPPRRAVRVEPKVAAEPARPATRPVRRNVVEPERPPTAVTATTQMRKLDIHVDPHVGDAIKERHMPPSGRAGQRQKGREMGTLGGRAKEVAVQRPEVHRFAIGDLKRAFVVNEILGPPLALRGRGEMRPL